MNQGGFLGYNIDCCKVLQQRSDGDRGAATIWTMVFYLGGESTFGFLWWPSLGQHIIRSVWESNLPDSDCVPQVGETFSALPEIKQYKNAGYKTLFFLLSQCP